MTAERCDECGFDSEQWSDDEALVAVAALPDRWREAVRGLDATHINERPIPTMWSIGEYSDHVRETIFGMRFILDIATTTPGTVLGPPPQPTFEPEPRPFDVDVASSAFAAEIAHLCDRLEQLSPDEWTMTVVIGDDTVDAHWIVRHAVHDVTHHLGDIARLRATIE